MGVTENCYTVHRPIRLFLSRFFAHNNTRVRVEMLRDLCCSQFRASIRGVRAIGAQQRSVRTHVSGIRRRLHTKMIVNPVVRAIQHQSLLSDVALDATELDGSHIARIISSYYPPLVKSSGKTG
ncbi:unnamed protein product [Ectocarpus sp. 12 AP-2014]